MTLKLDVSEHLVLVLCSRCPSWRGQARDRASGWAAGVEHAQRVHGDQLLAERARVAAIRCGGIAGVRRDR